MLAVAEDGLARSVPGLAEDANVSPAVVRGLIQAGALIPTELPEFAPFPEPDPDFAAPRLEPRSGAGGARLARCGRGQEILRPSAGWRNRLGQDRSLFRGGGRGAARSGKQVLILLPEIALTVQFLERFAARFGVRPAEWHSDLSQKERRRTYRAVMKGEARVVVGARSSLFLPFAELGLVIVDEEHEQAFKQQDGAIYHARDMAVVRARIENCPVVLASATPSLESFVNAQTGRYAHLKLTARHGVAELPEVQLIDLRHERDAPDANNAQMAVAAAARRRWRRRWRRANRRCCSSTGAAMRRSPCAKPAATNSPVPHCSAWLVEHRYKRRLACHQCGYEIAAPTRMPANATRTAR